LEFQTSARSSTRRLIEARPNKGCHVFKDFVASFRCRSLYPRRCIMSSILLLSAAVQVHAHHSFAMFDKQKTVTLQGTVKAFQWTNPHCWIQLLVPKDAVTQEWSVQMDSTTEVFRRGWRPHTLRAGDKVTLIVHPARDGSPGAALVSATGPDGAPLGKVRTAATP
jgi:Family of unknown function (DUF6152)